MIVHFAHTEQNQSTDKTTTSYRPGETVKNQRNSEQIALDIPNIVKDNDGYGGHGKTAEEVMQQAQAMNMDAEQDYMVLMSNSVSDEEYARLSRDGFDPADMEAEEVVTVLDRIKAALAEAGEIIIGYNDKMDTAVLEEITGSLTFANELTGEDAASSRMAVQALADYQVPLGPDNLRDVCEMIKKGLDVDEITDEMKKYLIQNNRVPTINNLYLAKYSAGTSLAKESGMSYASDANGYRISTSATEGWQQIEEQAKKILSDAGMEQNEENTGLAKWLYQHNIPLTIENLNQLSKLNQLKPPFEAEALAEACASAIHDYGTSSSAVMINEGSLISQAVKCKMELDSVTEGGIERVITEGLPFTIRSLYESSLSVEAAVYQIMSSSSESQPGQQDNDGLQVGEKDKKLVDSARHFMSVSVNMALIRRGISIETTDLPLLTEELQKENDRQNYILFGSAAEGSVREALFLQTMEKVSLIEESPAEVVGNHRVMPAMTFLELHELCQTTKMSYVKTNEEYEKLMTVPRADLGDSVRKAFSNMDSVISSLGLEDNEANRRAVRIITYSKMELSSELVQEVADRDAYVTGIMDRMKPAAVLSMIRKGLNPLDMTLDEIDRELTDGLQPTEKQAERYSSFLYELDRRGEITEEEKQSFIGIYRMMRQIEKTDGAALGMLVSQRSELTFANLLKAVRTRNKGTIQAIVDDNNGLTETKADTETSITDQIHQAFSDHEVIKSLKAYEIPVTVNHLVAMDALKTTGFSLYDRIAERLKKKTTDKETETVSEDVLLTDELLDAFEVGEQTQEAMRTFYEKTALALEESWLAGEGDPIDVRAAGLLCKQLSLASGMVKQDEYYIPVQTDSGVACMNVRIVHKGALPVARVMMEQPDGSKVAAAFEMALNASEEQKLTGYVTYDGAQDVMTESLQEFRDRAETAGIACDEVVFFRSNAIDLERFRKETERIDKKEVNTGERADARMLYRMVKELVISLSQKKSGGMRGGYEN